MSALFISPTLAAPSASPLTEGELTELTRRLLPPSFFCPPSPFPSLLQSLPEKTQLDGVYDLITAWTRCRITPPQHPKRSHSGQQWALVWVKEAHTSLPVISH